MLLVWVLLAAALCFVPPVSAQFVSDDFNDGNDVGWTQYDPRGDPLLAAFGQGPQAQFSFPNTNSYRIFTPVNAILTAAAETGRAGSLLESQVFSDFYVSVDVIDWDDTTWQAFGILARARNPGLQTLDGYAFTYERGSAVSATSGDTDLSIVTGEAPSGIPTGESSYHLDPAKDYRFVFIGKGFELEGRIYELPNIVTPVITINGVDDFESYDRGTVGLVTFDASSGMGVTDATFDNFVAQVSEPPRLSVSINSFGEVDVRWTTDLGPFRLQTADNLTPPIAWSDVTEPIFDEPPTGKLYIDGAPAGTRAFRLIQD